MSESPDDLSSFYYTEGAIPFDARCYVERPADQQLRRFVERGELCYVLTASQMGKTSLIFRAKAELDEQGIPTAYIDLHGFGTGPDVTMERWCRSFLRALAREMKLDMDLNDWWEAHNVFTPIDSLLTFIRDVVYEQTGGRGAIFIDEIGTALSLSFGDAFLSGVRSLYQYSDSDQRRPALVLIGMVPPDRLIRDRQTTRFNVGAQVPLGVLDFADAGVLLVGLPGRDEAILRRVFYWTNGHPYLTQRICRAIAQDSAVRDAGAVDDLVHRLLLADEALEFDSNLAYVRDALVENPRKTELLQVYRDILRGRQVKNLEQSPLHQELRFCGLARPDEGRLVVANPIYRRVFDKAWVRANSPFRWWRAVPRYAWVSVGIIVVLALLLAGALFRTIRSEREAEQQRNIALTRRLITESTALIDSRYDLALLLAVEAFNVQQVSETEAALRYGLTANPYLSTYLRKHEAQVNVVAFSPNGAAFASADTTGRIVLWDTAGRTPLPLMLEGQRAGVNALAFADDSSFLVSGGCARPATADCSSGEVAIWDLAGAGDRIGYFAAAAPEGHDGEVLAVALSRDDRYLASAGGSSLIVRQLPGGQVVRRVDRGAGGQITAVAFSPVTPDLLAFGDGRGGVGIIDLSGRSLDLEFTAHRDRVNGLDFSPDGRLLASAGRDGMIALWDAGSWEPVGPPFHAHPDAVYDIEFDAAGRLLSAGADGRIRRWNLAGVAVGEVEEELSLTGQGSVVWSFSVTDTPDGSLLASIGDNNTIVLWNLAGDPARGHWLSAGEGGVLGLDFSPDGSVLASAGEDGAIRLWDSRRGEPIGAPLMGHDGGARRVVFRPDGGTMASVGRDRRVLLWDVVTRRPRVLGEHEANVRDIAFSPGGGILASADDAGVIILWDVAAGRRVGDPIIAHDAEIFDVEFSPDGRLLASAGWDGAVRFWNPITRSPLGESVATGYAEIWDMEFSPDGALLAVAGSGVDVLLVDVATRAVVGTLLTNQTARIISLAFSPDGALLATGSTDSTIAIWDMTTRRTVGRPLGMHRDDVYALAFSPDGSLLASADLGGRIFLSVVEYDDPVRTACGVAARDLSPEEGAQYIGGDGQPVDRCLNAGETGGKDE